MAYPIQAFTHGMTPVPLSTRAIASYEANRASKKAQDEVFARGGSIEEANTAGRVAADAVMSEVAA